MTKLFPSLPTVPCLLETNNKQALFYTIELILTQLLPKMLLQNCNDLRLAVCSLKSLPQIGSARL